MDSGWTGVTNSKEAERESRSEWKVEKQISTKLEPGGTRDWPAAVGGGSRDDLLFPGCSEAQVSGYLGIEYHGGERCDWHNLKKHDVHWAMHIV